MARMRSDDRPIKRVQIDMPAKSLARLERLQHVTEAASAAEVIRNALRLYEALVDEVEDGHQLYVKRGAEMINLQIFAG